MNIFIKRIVSKNITSSLLSWVGEYQIFLLILIASVVFIGLGRSSLLDYDEGIYSQVAREMVLKNDWLTPHFGGVPWFEKPPLYIWATAITFKIFGINEFGARAVSAFSSVIIVLLTYLLGSTIFGRRVGFLSIVPLMTGYEFLRQSRNGTTDILLTLFIFLVLAFYTRNLDRTNTFWYWLSVVFALGFMVKFWASFIVVMAIGVSLLIEGRLLDTFSNKNFWGAALLALALILPWHIAMYMMHDQAFVNRYFLYDLLARSTTPLEGNAGTARYYFDRMAYDYSPWFFVIPLALTLELKRVLIHRDRSSVLLIFATLIFGVYSILISTKIFHYLTPIYPILAIFLANIIVQAYDEYRSTAFSGLLIAASVATIVFSRKVLAIFLVLVGLLFCGLFLLHYITSLSRRPVEGESQNKSRLDSVLLFLTLLGSFSEKKNLSKLVVIVMCIFLAIPGILRSRPLYKAEESPVEQIARIAGDAKIIQNQIILGLALPPDYENGLVGPAAMFYSNRPIEVAWSREELAKYTSEGPREIILGESYIDPLKDEYDFTPLARRPPFFYGVIQRHNGQGSTQPSP